MGTVPRLLAAGLLGLTLLHAAEAQCASGPRSITGLVLNSSDGVAVPTSSNTLISALNTNGTKYANSSAITDNRFFYDAGSLWGSWCDGDLVEVTISTTTSQGTYTATTSNATTTDPTTFPDTRLQPPPDTTPPGPVTGLANTTYQHDRITWSWTNPTDSDFSKVMVLLDGVFKANVTGTSYEATGLNAVTNYTISVKSVDTAGNAGSPVNHTATTAPEPPPSTPTPTPAPAGGGGGGGGGGGAGAETSEPVQPPPAPVLIEVREELPPAKIGETAKVVLASTPVQEIAVEAARNINAPVRITVRRFASAPSTVSSAPPGKTYAHLSIEAEGLDAGDVAKVTLKTKVERSWVRENGLSPEGLKVQRYTTGWTPLPTQKESEDAQFVYLSAESPGLSFFAVTGELLPEPSPAGGLGPATGPASPTPKPVYLPPVGGEPPGPARTPGLEGPLAALALLGALGLCRKR